MAAHRIGLIGCGWIAPFHVAGLSQLGRRGEIVWVADPDEEHARTLAREAGARAITDYRTGLSDIDCAFVLIPHHLHPQVTVDCLKAGCHVLLEKPIANSLAEADTMIAAAEQNRRTLMVAYPHRYKRSFRLFKQAIDSGRYGRLIMLDSLMDDMVEGYLAEWMTRKATLGGGCLFSASGHQLDIMLWISGDVHAAYMVGTRGRVPMEGEDSAACILKFKNGSIGVARHTWASPRVRIWYTMEAMCEKAHVTLTCTPLGDQNTEGVRCRWQTRIVAQGKQDEVLLESDEGLDLAPEIEHFFECVDTGRTPETDGRMARKVSAVVLEAYRRAAADGANV
ncbi:MAG: Gfo/Idh/MocA family oxidoreductase [Acidobacteriia bacterium]|nr:Gfo/Idh/MocA family oxidoreductase [Terriglobia bacterium]